MCWAARVILNTHTDPCAALGGSFFSRGESFPPPKVWEEEEHCLQLLLCPWMLGMELEVMLRVTRSWASCTELTSLWKSSSIPKSKQILSWEKPQTLTCTQLLHEIT